MHYHLHAMDSSDSPLVRHLSISLRAAKFLLSQRPTRTFVFVMPIFFQDDNLVDVLELLVKLMAEHPASMVPASDRKHAVR